MFPSTTFVSGPISGRTVSRLSIGGLSLTGVYLFVTCCLVIASGFLSLRPMVMGLAVYPHLILVALAFPFVVMARIGRFPMRVLMALSIFIGIYWFSILSGSSIGVGEIFKTGSAIVTIITCALLVRRRGDFVAASLGLGFAVAALAANGLKAEAEVAVEAMEGANRNSYSLFALPAILMAGYIYLRMPSVPKVVKGLLLACVVPSLVAIFMSGNRSGYLGVVLVGFMLLWDRRGKGLLLVAVVTAIAALWVVKYGSTTVFDERLRQTVEGNKSDNMRRDILITCLKIGLENPVIGVSPRGLPLEIGRRISTLYHTDTAESHNIFAQVFAGSGVICFAALLAVGWTLWSWKPREGGKIGGKDDPFREARLLLRMMVILWVVRGMFTPEILYNPSFNIGIGLAIGLCILAEEARKQAPAVGLGRSRLAGQGRFGTAH